MAMSATLDLAGVGALRQAVGEESFRRLAGRFLENSERRFGEWEDLIRKGEADAVRTTAHAFAGTLGQFGLAATADIARRVEHEADDAARLILAREVTTRGRRELEAFKAWLDGGGAG